MLKWCKAICKNQSEVLLTVDQGKKSLLEGHGYQALDSSFREGVDDIAKKSFSQQEIKRTSLGNRQISCLDIPYSLTILDIEYENKQYQAWIKNIKVVLQRIEKEDIPLKKVPVSVWKKLAGGVSQNLRSENSILIEENEKKSERIESLLNQLEEIKKETAKTLQKISNFFSSEIPIVNVIEPDIASCGVVNATNNAEEDLSLLVREISVESGYGSHTESDVSNRSSIDSFLGRVEEDPLQLSNYQKLIKKNGVYKAWISTVEERFGAYASSKLLDLKNLSFQKIKLIEKGKKQDKKLQSLEIQLIEAKEDKFALREDDHALQKVGLWKDIHQHQFLNQLEREEENINEIQKELEDIEKDINTLQEKVAGLNVPIETFTVCLEKTEILNYLKKLNQYPT